MLDAYDALEIVIVILDRNRYSTNSTMTLKNPLLSGKKKRRLIGNKSLHRLAKIKREHFSLQIEKWRNWGTKKLKIN